jgi:hypothetical protein
MVLLSFFHYDWNIKANKVTFPFFSQITIVEEYFRIKFIILFSFLLQRLGANLIKQIKEVYTE